MKQNGVVCWPGLSLLFFIFRFEYLISGPKSYRDFRETGPRRLSSDTQGRSVESEKTAVANNIPHLSHFWANVIFAIPP